MPLSSRFTISLHILSLLGTKDKEKMTSQLMAASIGVNPVVVRKVLGHLKTADIITVKRGQGGANMAKSPEAITYFDVYRAVEIVPEAGLFNFHNNPNPACAVGKNIHAILDDDLAQAQETFESFLKTKTIAQLLDKTNQYIQD